MARGQSSTTAGEQSGWNRPLPVPVFWNILLSMRIYDILFEHMAKSINSPKSR